MPKKPRITSPVPKKQYTRDDVEHAAASAREMIAQSPVLQTCLTTMIVSRRLYMIARSAMDNEVEHGWDCDDPELIAQTMVASAQEKATESFRIANLQQTLLGNTVPFLDIIIRQGRETGETGEITPPTEQTDEPTGPTEPTGPAVPAVPPADPTLLPGGDDGTQD